MLRRLSETSTLYPRCYVLKGTTVVSGVISGGGFCDIYQGRYGEHSLCLKVVRLFQTSEKENILKVRFFISHISYLLSSCHQLYGNEAILWGQLHHPNIVPFYGVYYLGDVLDGRICLVSPWMTNGNLVQFIEANRPVDRKKFVGAIPLPYRETLTNLFSFQGLRYCLWT